jgi:7,8-dihydropterin-6-yl-methyl-4-(beta-D-ribofuranosyl)aminobenzene 5'-phosphate synthase
MLNKITCVVNDIVEPGRGLLSEHGLSFWIEKDQAIALFDTGQTAAVLENNLRVLDLEPKNVQALALSHAHYDHTGGLEAVLGKNPDLRIYAHLDIFRARYSKRKGEYRSIGMQMSRDDLENAAELSLNAEPDQMLPGLWTTGEISPRPELEGRSNHHYLKDGDAWLPDEYKDDLSLVMEVEGGIVLICGCCHAGLLNTLFYVEKKFPQPLRAVIGGTHLLTADGEYLRHVMDVIDTRFPDMRFYLNHCTGENAIQKFKQKFGGRVAAFPAGSVADFA